MAKRFGRNQRRKMREEIASATREAESQRRTASSYAARAYQAEREMKELRARCIEADVKLFDIPRDMLFEFRMEARRYDDPRRFSWAQRIDKRVSEIERDRAKFIYQFAMIAAEALADAMRLTADEHQMLNRLFPDRRERVAFRNDARRIGWLNDGIEYEGMPG